MKQLVKKKAANGSIFLNGKLIKRINRDIGYCPQYDFIQDKLTLEVCLYLFGRLRGIVNHHLKKTIKVIYNLFLCDHETKQYIKQLSRGTIRKIHTAIACLEPPTIILLDFFAQLEFEFKVVWDFVRIFSYNNDYNEETDDETFTFDNTETDKA
ncbi:unnamed protein product [Rotaria sp. Silwood2]|nr:unnamed protein product [Rotaria sp. Silwood2]